MKKKLILAILAVTMLATACGKKDTKEIKDDVKDEVSSVYQEELGLDKEDADALAEVVVDLQEEDMVSEAENNEDTASEEANKESLIWPSIKDAMDSTMYMFDSSIYSMTEEEVVEKYSAPARKEGDSLIWESDDFGGMEVTLALGSCYDTIYLLKTRAKSEFTGIREDFDLIGLVDYIDQYHDYDISYDKISDWFDDSMFNNAYDYSTLTTYDDFVERFGKPGIVYKIWGNDVDIAWPVPEAKRYFKVRFHADTGEKDDVSPAYLRYWKRDENGRQTSVFE